MPLSEYEQRVLHEMEQQLRSEDPRLASDFRGPRPGLDARTVLLAVTLVLAGLGALLGGVTQSWIWLGVLGFLLMLAGVMVVVGGQHRPGRGDTRTQGRAGGRAPRTRHTGRASGVDDFMTRQSEKWERRQGGGRP